MVKKIAEKFNRLSGVHQRHRQTDRQTTDGRLIAYSERNVERSLIKVVALITQADGRRGTIVFSAVCLSVFPQDILKNDAARITKRDVQMFHDES